MNYAHALPSAKSLLVALGLAFGLLLPNCSVEDPNPYQSEGGTSPGSAGSPSAGGNSAGSGVATAGAAPSAGAGPVGGSSGSATTGGASGSASGGASMAGSSAAGTASMAGSSAGGSVSAGVSGLPVPPGAASVPKPAGAVGGLQVVNWAGFKAAVSYTFDDTNSSQIAHYKELAALGVHFTFYLITGKTEINDPVWVQAAADGHELGNHTKSHSSNATGEDIDAATTLIEDKFKTKVWTMAAPNGAAGYTDLAKTRFLINRGVANGLVAPNDNSDPFTLFCYIPPTGASQAAMDMQVTDARTAGKWRIVLVHGFTGGTDGAYQPVAFDQFSASVTASKALGDVWIDSVVNVGAYWLGQKAFTKAAPAASGAGTYTWTLPAHFPPGKYLRVSVTGGTLTQKGAALAWDPHGYYEVALDAGSLTLAP
jgi:peptidoglycan/xylan/chitin deacetylase (PgdA/CDA1 family)